MSSLPVDNSEIINGVAIEEDVTSDDVEEVVSYQFRLVKKVMESSTFEEVRLYKFGRFYVKEGRLKELEEKGDIRRENGSIKNGKEGGN